MKQYITIFILLICLSVNAQIGGENTFEFLSLPKSARITAMGGSYMSNIDHDLSLALQNPAGLSNRHHKMFTGCTNIFYGRTIYGHFGYAYDVKKIATFSASVQFVNYGKISRTDEAGNIMGTFRPNEWAIQIGASRQIAPKYHLGANVKFISSNIEQYRSGGVALDMAASYLDTAKNFCATLLIKDIGVQFNPYVKGQKREPLPFDIQLGFSYKPKFLPFRFSLIAHNLFRWNIRYDDPRVSQNTTVFGDSSEIKNPKRYIFDKIARHFIIGTEITIKKVVRINFAYNHMHRGEHAFENKKSLAGFSFGLGVHVKQFDVSYGIQVFAKGFTSHHFSLNIAFDKFIKKKS